MLLPLESCTILCWARCDRIWRIQKYRPLPSIRRNAAIWPNTHHRYPPTHTPLYIYRNTVMATYNNNNNNNNNNNEGLVKNAWQPGAEKRLTVQESLINYVNSGGLEIATEQSAKIGLHSKAITKRWVLQSWIVRLSLLRRSQKYPSSTHEHTRARVRVQTPYCITPFETKALIWLDREKVRSARYAPKSLRILSGAVQWFTSVPFLPVCNRCQF